jgi:predicted ATPase
MLKHLTLQNVGPAAQMALEFAPRLNLITGDNGLGKSFLLDIAWWALTRKWPNEINPRLPAGKKAIPSTKGTASIGFSFRGKTNLEDYVSSFLRREQAWTGRPGRPANPGMVFYAMADGSFAVWDPARNYWRTQGKVDVQDRVPAYVFSPVEVWDGLTGKDGKPLCNGLVLDWAGWQKEKGAAFESLCAVLEVMSPSPTEPLVPGTLARISLDDARDIPTLRMAYGQDVPVLHASAGMRRILSLAYLLVWTWEEHCKAAELLGEPPTGQVVFLVDEVESHLHPQWQRRVIPALLAVVGKLIQRADVQVIAATHSPMIMASVEPLFQAERDAWFDLDLERQRVVLRQRDFEKHGDAAGWLISEAFRSPVPGKSKP